MKNRTISYVALAACVVVLVATAGAGPPAPKAKTVTTVTVTGVGTSKDLGVKDALRKAVEKGAGTYIYSQSKVSDFVLVRDTILARAAGFVQSYDVLSAKRMEDETWEVKIKAVVSVKGIIDAWGTTKALLKQMGRPRIVVYVNEKINGRLQEESTVQARIENLLLKSGFLLVDKKQIHALMKRDKIVALLADKPEQFIALMKKARAQIVITGTAYSASGTVRRVSGINLYPYEAEATIRTFRVDTGQLISKIPGRPTRDVARVWRSAAKKALDRQARMIAPIVRENILRFWLDAVGGRGAVELNIENLTFKQYREMKKALVAMKAVKEVNGKYNKALTRFDVQAELNAEDLAEKIADAFEQLEITDVSQNTIQAKFKVGSQ